MEVFKLNSTVECLTQRRREARAKRKIQNLEEKLKLWQEGSQESLSPCLNFVLPTNLNCSQLPNTYF